MITKSYHWTDEFIYIFDPELHEHINKSFKLRKKFVDTGLNVSTEQHYWKYISVNEILNVVVPWEDEKRKVRLSLDRWGKS